MGAPPLVVAPSEPMAVDPALLRAVPQRLPAVESPAAAMPETPPLVATQPTAPHNPERITAAAKPAPKPAVLLVVVARPLEAPLDVAALKIRLRDTHAIGVFTKLALRNQMDDLLKQFRSHYQGEQKTSVATLRQPYDRLILKVLALVQDGDPSLAHTIAGSREELWNILADPEQFKSII